MQIRTSLVKHQNLLIFCSGILLFGVIAGVIFYIKQDASVKELLMLNNELFNTNLFGIKNLFVHLLIIFVVIATSFIFLSVPITILALFFEAISIGFVIPIFLTTFKIKWILVFSVYLLLVKFIYIIILIVLLFNSIKFTKKYLLFTKNRKIEFFSSLKRMFLICLVSIMNDLTIYFIFNKVLIFLLN